MVTGKRDFDNLFKSHCWAIDDARARIDDDFDLLARLFCGKEALNAFFTKINNIATLNQTISPTADLKEDTFTFLRLGDAVKLCAADCRLAPTNFVIINDQLKIPIRKEGNKAFSAAITCGCNSCEAARIDSAG